ncbi:MAG: hypothetical protein WBQ44_13365 [Rhodococcus sp. (in: high G+C Gram-positive bacteria)]
MPGSMSESHLRALAGRDPLSADDVARAVDRCFAPIRVQVSGRSGVGKSTVRAVLDASGALLDGSVALLDGSVALSGDRMSVVETAPMDVPGSLDPVLDGDVLVHVMGGGPQQADLDVVCAATEVVAVLAKADTLDDEDAAARALSLTVGVPVYPLMGTIAAALARDQPETFASLRPIAAQILPEMLLTPDRFLSAELPIPREERAVLSEQIELHGVRVVTRALTADPGIDDAALRSLLADESGADAVVAAVRRAIDGVMTDRQGRLLHELTAVCARHPLTTEELEGYLASDEVVVIAMRSGLRALGEAEEADPTPATVRTWRARSTSARDPGEARAALAVARGYLRSVIR